MLPEGRWSLLPWEKDTFFNFKTCVELALLHTKPPISMMSTVFEQFYQGPLSWASMTPASHLQETLHQAGTNPIWPWSLLHGTPFRSETWNNLSQKAWTLASAWTSHPSQLASLGQHRSPECALSFVGNYQPFHGLWRARVQGLSCEQQALWFESLMLPQIIPAKWLSNPKIFHLYR